MDPVDPSRAIDFNTVIIAGVRGCGKTGTLWEEVKTVKLLFAGFLLAASMIAAPADDAKKTPAEAKDPVCGMTVDTKTSDKAEYKGKTYYFCSKDEKETFLKTPEKFVPKDGGKETAKETKKKS
jgi:YHS domain-containing protein